MIRSVTSRVWPRPASEAEVALREALVDRCIDVVNARGEHDGTFAPYVHRVRTFLGAESPRTGDAEPPTLALAPDAIIPDTLLPEALVG